MGVDTKAIIRKGTTLPEIVQVTEEHFTEVRVLTSYSNYLYQICFKDGKDPRYMSVFINNYAKVDYGIDGIILSLSYWGNSVEIMKKYTDKFGGYIDENDCDDVGFIPYNEAEFLKGNDMSRHDQFTLDIIHKFGYENLHPALEILTKYTSNTSLPTEEELDQVAAKYCIKSGLSAEDTKMSDSTVMSYSEILKLMNNYAMHVLKKY